MLMKKVICLLLAILMLGVLFSACNKQLIDTTYNFNEAYVFGKDGKVIVHGEVDGWKDWDDGSDMIQVKIHGVTYYTSIENVILIAR